MFIAPQHKGKTHKVMALQMVGWAYESHCWEQMDGSPKKICQWCGATSTEDMKIDGQLFPGICNGNPLVKMVYHNNNDYSWITADAVGVALAMVLPWTPTIERLTMLQAHDLVEAFEWAASIVRKIYAEIETPIMPKPEWLAKWEEERNG